MIQDYDGIQPVIHEDAWVHDGAWVIGEVELDSEVSIWPSAVLRGDMGVISIGAQSNIQDGAVCHNTGGLSETRVGKRVTVGHRAILHGCTVEDNCLIGMGAIILDNAHIGAGSIVGAGAVVTMNKVIPPGSLVLGNPGRVVRSMTEKDSKMLEYGWMSYLKMMNAWKKQNHSS